MGTKGREIVGLEVDKLIESLNKAFADEWLAYYQYWVSAKIARGRRREMVVRELTENGEEELKHAGMLADRIIQLGGTPLTNITELNDKANCKYANPTNADTVAILRLAINGERCAIDVYTKMLEMVKDKDPITYHIALDILEDEVEHEEEFESMLEDIR